MLYHDPVTGVRIEAVLRLDGNVTQEHEVTGLLPGQKGGVCVVPVKEKQLLSILYRISGPQESTIADLKLDGRFRFSRTHTSNEAKVRDVGRPKEICGIFDHGWSRRKYNLHISRLGIGPDDVSFAPSTGGFSIEVGVIELNFWISQLPQPFASYATWNSVFGGHRTGQSFEDDYNGPAGALQDTSSFFPAHKLAGPATNRVVPLSSAPMPDQHALAVRMVKQQPLPRGGLVTFKFLYRDAMVLADRMRCQALINPYMSFKTPRRATAVAPAISENAGRLTPPTPASPKQSHLVPSMGVTVRKPIQAGPIKQVFTGVIKPKGPSQLQPQNPYTTTTNVAVPNMTLTGLPKPVDLRSAAIVSGKTNMKDTAMVELTDEQFVRRLTLVDFSWRTAAQAAHESPASPPLVKVEPMDDEVEFVSERILRQPAHSTRGADAVLHKSMALTTSEVDGRKVERKRRREELTAVLREVEKELAELEGCDDSARDANEDEGDQIRSKRIKTEQQG